MEQFNAFCFGLSSFHQPERARQRCQGASSLARAPSCHPVTPVCRRSSGPAFHRSSRTGRSRPPGMVQVSRLSADTAGGEQESRRVHSRKRLTWYPWDRRCPGKNPAANGKLCLQKRQSFPAQLIPRDDTVRMAPSAVCLFFVYQPNLPRPLIPSVGAFSLARRGLLRVRMLRTPESRISPKVFF